MPEFIKPLSDPKEGVTEDLCPLCWLRDEDREKGWNKQGWS